MPDIDLDIERQDEIFNYLLEKYTASHISRIFIRKKIGWKTSLNQSLKIFRIKDIEKEEILKFSENILETNSLKLQHLKIKYPVFFSLVDKISDLYFDISIHPSSIIISNYSLVGMVPIRKKENFPFSFFSGEELEKLGLRRYDFLSLKESLGFISDVKNLKFLSNLKFDLKINLPTFQEVDLFDKKTWNLLMNFCLSGIFQLDTKFTRSLFIRFCPKNFTELIIFLSINRPGSRKKLEDIIKRKNNNTKESSFSSNKIREILLETYDFIIFEEQISQIFCLIFDCSFAEAELKRIRLKEKGLEEDFFKKAYEKLSNSDIKLITKQLLFSREYSFNKSHAVAYSYLTYYIAFLKANFFSELIIFFLNEKKEKKINYIQEAIFFDFIIKKPDINYSEINWIKEKKTLIMGFSDLNKNNNTFFSSIIVERKEKGLYDNWENFLSRTYKFWENIKIEHFNNWIDSEIFLSLKVDSSVIKENIDSIFRYIDIRKKLGNVDNKLLPFSFFPLSKEKKEENNREINEKEQKNLNCYISFFSRWNDFKRKGEINSLFDIFQKENNCEVIVKIYAVIYHIEKEKKKWILSFRDIRSFFKIEVDDIFFENNKVNLMKHNEMILNCSVKITNKKINHILLRKIN